MGRTATWALIGVLTASGGCGTSGEMIVDVHTPSARTVATIDDWSRVARLHAGADVVIDVDASDAVYGKVLSVSDDAVTLTGHAPISRASIQRVARVQSLSKLRAGKGTAIGFGFGVLTLVATAGLVWQPLVGYPLLGAGIGSGSAIGVERQTVVYQRR